MLYDATQRGGRSVEKLCLSIDDNGFGSGRNLKREIQRRILAYQQLQPLLLFRSKAGVSGRDVVRSRRQERQIVGTVLRGDGLTFEARGRINGTDLRSDRSRARAVENRTRESAVGGLSRGRRRDEKKQDSDNT